jgi:hypothetical protein
MFNQRFVAAVNQYFALPCPCLCYQTLTHSSLSFFLSFSPAQPYIYDPCATGGDDDDLLIIVIACVATALLCCVFAAWCVASRRRHRRNKQVDDKTDTIDSEEGHGLTFSKGATTGANATNAAAVVIAFAADNDDDEGSVRFAVTGKTMEAKSVSKATPPKKKVKSSVTHASTTRSKPSKPSKSKASKPSKSKPSKPSKSKATWNATKTKYAASDGGDDEGRGETPNIHERANSDGNVDGGGNDGNGGVIASTMAAAAAAAARVAAVFSTPSYADDDAAADNDDGDENGDGDGDDSVLFRVTPAQAYVSPRLAPPRRKPPTPLTTTTTTTTMKKTPPPRPPRTSSSSSSPRPFIAAPSPTASRAAVAAEQRSERVSALMHTLTPTPPRAVKKTREVQQRQHRTTSTSTSTPTKLKQLSPQQKWLQQSAKSGADNKDTDTLTKAKDREEARALLRRKQRRKAHRSAAAAEEEVAARAARREQRHVHSTQQTQQRGQLGDGNAMHVGVQSKTSSSSAAAARRGRRVDVVDVDI